MSYVMQQLNSEKGLENRIKLYCVLVVKLLCLGLYGNIQGFRLTMRYYV